MLRTGRLEKQNRRVKHEAPALVPSQTPQDSSITRSRTAVAAVFAVNGLIVSSWVSRIPAVQSKLHMNAGVLGVVLLATAAGSLISMPVTGWVIAHKGSRPLVQATTLLLSLALVPISFARTPAELAAALLLFGAVAGSQNVSMNTHAVSVEQAYERPLMGSFHAMWSLGAMAGSGLGGLLAGLNWTAQTHFTLVVGFVFPLSLFAISWLHRPEHNAAAVSKLTLKIPIAVAGLGLIGCAISVVEGSVADWSAVYLDSVIGAGAARAALGFSFYSAAMIVSRLLADAITARIGRASLVQAGSLVAFTGLVIALLTHSWAVAVTGFALTGLGVATIIPNVFGAAGRVEGIPSGVGMAAVTTLGYLGFLGGPPLIGGLAQAFGLRLGLCFVLLCLLLAAAFARLIPEQ